MKLGSNVEPSFSAASALPASAARRKTSLAEARSPLLRRSDPRSMSAVISSESRRKAVPPSCAGGGCGRVTGVVTAWRCSGRVSGALGWGLTASADCGAGVDAGGAIAAGAGLSCSVRSEFHSSFVPLPGARNVGRHTDNAELLDESWIKC